MRTLKIIMHTHWDREWYFTKDETKVLLKNHMVDVICFLEKNPDVIYVLDGQSVMIDDFLEQGSEYEERMGALIRKKQLRAGPWYTQTDLLLVSGESIIRNLYYGIKAAQKYGDAMLVGYAPDTFGHSSQMPQIYKQFGIESTFFWRGFSELKASKSDFLWKGVDGSVIYGINLATGYQGAKYLEEEKAELQPRMEKILRVLDKYSASDARLIMNGHDQMPIQKNIKHVMEHLSKLYPEDQIEISDFESYVDELRMCSLETVEGDLNDCKHARIHKTIGSTRMDIKLLNTELEHKLFEVLEPLSLLAVEIGLDYPHELIEESLKILFGVHAHDSIGGCNSDLVNRDIKQRLLVVKEKVDTQIELFMRLISLSAESESKSGMITVYNMLPQKRADECCRFFVQTLSKNFEVLSEDGERMPFDLLSQKRVYAGEIDRQVAAKLEDIWVFESEISLKISKMEGLSVRYLQIEEKEEKSGISPSMNESEISNEVLSFFIKDDKICLYDKKKDVLYENILWIENGGDAGDSYDYSPPKEDLIFGVKDAKISNVKTKQGEIGKRLSCTVSYFLPQNEQERSLKASSVSVIFELEFTLIHEKISLKIRHQNKTCDSRFRLVFTPNIQTDWVESDSHLSHVRKPVYNRKQLAVWEAENWAEKPVSVETYQSYVRLRCEDEDTEAMIVSRGLKEYEVKDGSIFLTLFRSFSHLGKRELVNRPGRPSGIEIETKDNQLLEMAFEFEFMFTVGKVDNPAQESKLFLAPLVGYHLKLYNRFNLNPPEVRRKITNSLSIPLKSLIVSAIKQTEEGRIFIRVFNPGEKEVAFSLENGYQSNVFEEILEPRTDFSVRSQEILNIIIKEG